MDNDLARQPVGVVGEGATAAGIARLAARARHPVHQVTADAVDALPPCALVIEAAEADLDRTCDIFEELGRHQPETTILASASGELTVDDIAPMAIRPARVIGLHLVEPVEDNPVVEVVRCQATCADTVVGVMSLMTQWGKAPVRCASVPGLIVQRVFGAVVGETQRMVAQGIADPTTLDACLRAAGLAVGPFELGDRLGQDRELAFTRSLWLQTRRDPRYAPTDYAQSLVRSGRLGVAAGRGALTYAADGHPIEEPDQRLVEKLLAADLLDNPVERAVSLAINEAVEIVHRGEAGARDVDLALTLGRGFPQGPVAWGREIGYLRIRDRLLALDDAFGSGRYGPSQALSEIE